MEETSTPAENPQKTKAKGPTEEYERVDCKVCSKTMNLTSLSRHVKQKHPEFTLPNKRKKRTGEIAEVKLTSNNDKLEKIDTPKDKKSQPKEKAKDPGKVQSKEQAKQQAKELKKLNKDLKKENKTEQPGAVEMRVPKVPCPFCEKTVSRKHFKQHIDNLHPGKDYAHIKALALKKASKEGNPLKRIKTADEPEVQDLDDVSTTHSKEAPQLCACGYSFSRQVYYQVHDTLFHRSFSTLKRCDSLGCFGLFLNAQLHDIHRATVH